MNIELPFTLKVAGKDEVDGIRAVSTSFHFHGWLRLQGDVLQVEWSGHARVQDVELLSARDEQLPLPAELLLIPVARLRRAELRGGWWRPRIAITAGDTRTLAIIPSEELGTVCFWYARRDGAAAHALCTALTGAIGASHAVLAEPGRVVHLSDSTPITPVTPVTPPTG